MMTAAETKKNISHLIRFLEWYSTKLLSLCLIFDYGSVSNENTKEKLFVSLIYINPLVKNVCKEHTGRKNYTNFVVKVIF